MELVLEDLRLNKQERINEFSEILSQIAKICTEISSADQKVHEQDLTLKKLEELKSHLQELQNEKLQDLGSTLLELWNLMGTSADEQKAFNHVTCLISSSLGKESLIWMSSNT